MVERQVFRKKEAAQLLEGGNGMCVSFYLPTHRAGSEIQQDRIQLKNLVAEAWNQLELYDWSPQKIGSFLAPAESLIEDTIFWRHQRDGLAIFMTDGSLHRYSLPVDFQPFAYTGSRYHIKPLIPMLMDESHFYLLLLDLEESRLLHMTPKGIEEMDLGDTPTSMEAALKYDDPEQHLQYHTGTTSAQVRGEQDAAFHGQGVSSDTAKKERILRFFQRLDHGVRRALEDEAVPLLLAGTEYLLPIYREANHYPHLLDVAIKSNLGGKTDSQIERKAWDLVEPQWEEPREDALERFYELEANSDQTSTGLEQCVPSAHYGQVDVLFVVKNQQQWGQFDPDKNQVSREPTFDRDLVDLMDMAAADTIRNGGAVYLLEQEAMPVDDQMAAILRY
ncbi:MAG: hypothetical protein PVF49_08230 [Anaerolineales bacterium]